MKRFSRVFFFLLALACVACGNLMFVSAAEADSATVIVSYYTTSAGLSSSHETTTYTGDVVVDSYTDTPRTGYQYLIASVDITVPAAEAPYALSQLTLSLAGSSYLPLDGQFLENHYYSPFTSTTLSSGNQTGHIVYEIPLESDIASAQLVYDGGAISFADVEYQSATGASVVKDSNINISSSGDDAIAAQEQMDAKLQQAAENPDYTFAQAYVVQNPYGNAPLTAVAVFQTETPATISVSIQAKDDSGFGEVCYTIEESGLSHIIPILGLYANYNNVVTLTADYGTTTETQTIRLQTGTLPSSISDITLETLAIDASEAHFTQIGFSTGYNVIVDMQGETRWYYNEVSNLRMAYLDNGHILLEMQQLSGTGNEDVNKTGILYEVDMLGKIYHVYELNDNIHHEMRYIGDNLLAYTGNQETGVGMEDAITVIDLTTGEVVEHIDLNEILQRSHEIIGYGNSEDWCHINSLDYDAATDSFILSGRQFGVVKLDSERNVEWIVAPDYGWDSTSEEYLLTPVDADGNPLYDMTTEEGITLANTEFFQWHQHGIEFAPDLDGNPDTIEISLFDNRDVIAAYGLDSAPIYSQGVVYSIDPQAMTICRLWAYGDALGESFWSPTASDANVLENGNLLITSGDLQRNAAYNGMMIEVNSDNEELWRLGTSLAIWCAEEVSLYPEGWQVDITTSVQTDYINPKVQAAQDPLADAVTVSDLAAETLTFTRLTDGRIQIVGTLEGFDFQKQYGYLTLTTATGEVDTYGFLIEENNVINVAIAIQDSDYVTMQVKVLDPETLQGYVYPARDFTIAEMEFTAWESTANAASIRYYIDSIAIDASVNQLSIQGWAFIQNHSLVGDTQMNLVLIGADNQVAYSFAPTVRADVTAAFGGTSYNYNDSGISCNVSLANLPTDRYTLAFEIINDGVVGYVSTSYYIEIEQPELETVSVEDTLQQQAEIDAALLAAYAQESYTLAQPYVVVDPYDQAPLSAIIMFETDAPATISIEVAGLNGGETLTHSFDTLSESHTLPIYGLYALQATDVTLCATYADGTTETQTISVTGHALPADVDAVTVVYSSAEMAAGLTFCEPPARIGCAYAVDGNGDVRFAFSDKNIAIGTTFLQLSNGHILTVSDRYTLSSSADSLIEIDCLGRIYAEYMANNVHHDATELPSGNLLVLAGDQDGQTIEDAVYEIDRTTGEIVRYWDMAVYFPTGNVDENGNLTADENYGSGTTDWVHLNALEYRESDDSMILSGRMQDAVIKISLDTGELDWVLSNPDDLWTQQVAEKLLTPIGDDFEWSYGQHNCTWLPNGDLMLFDNGTYRAKTADEIPDLSESYSRVVIYRIDEEAGTIEQIWQCGKELGHDYLSTFVSSSQYLGEDHYLMNFGGIQLDADGVPQYSGGTGRACYIMEWKDGEIVFAAENTSTGITAGNYQALRLNPYENVTEIDLTVSGVRLGSNFAFGVAEPAVLHTSAQTFALDAVQVVDNGTQLVVSANMQGATGREEVYLYLVGEVGTYRVPMTAKESMQLTINSIELPIDTYTLYIKCDNTLCPLYLEWAQTLTASAPLTEYAITLTASQEAAGWVSQGGNFCAGTALSVMAQANSGYQFVGWYADGVLVSEVAEYSFIPTQDIALTAEFETVGLVAAIGAGASPSLVGVGIGVALGVVLCVAFARRKRRKTAGAASNGDV